MPTVPRRDPASTVDLKPYPEVGVTGGATEETFGGGPSAAAVSNETKALGDIGIKLAIQQRDDADKTAAQQFDVAAVQKKNEITQTITNDYRGNDALKAEDYAKGEWSAFIRQQEKSIPNDRVAQMMGRKYASYYGQIDNHATTHVASQMEAVKSETYKANSDIKIQDAAVNWNNPLIRNQAVTDLRANVEKRMNEIGIHDKNDPIYKAELDKQMSDLHKRTIESMLATEDPAVQELAKKYVKENQKELLGKDGAEMANYVDSKIKNTESEKKAITKQDQDQNFHDFLLKLNDGSATLTDASQLLRTINPKTGSPMLSDSDFLQIVGLTSNEKYLDRTDESSFGKAGDERFPTSPDDAYNKVTAAIKTKSLNGQYASPRELTDMVKYYHQNRLLSDLDSNVKLKQIKDAPKTLDEERTASQAAYIDQAVRKYSRTGWFGTTFGESEASKKKAAASVVKQFYDDVDSKKLTGDKIDELAAKYVHSEIAKGFPEMAQTPPEKLPHIIYSTKTGVQRLLDPGTPTKLKGKLVWQEDKAVPSKKDTKQ